MAGITSMDDFINAVTTNGRFFRSDWNKATPPTTAAAAGEWFSWFRGGGNPAADAILNTGTNLLAQQLKDTTTNATGIMHGGDVTPYYKHLVNVSAVSASVTTAPALLMLVDQLLFYRVTSVTTATAQATTNTLFSFSNFTCNSNDVITHTNINLMPYSRIQVSTTVTLPTGLSAATNYHVIKLTDTTCKLATSYANAVAGTAISITTGTGSGTHTINNLLPRYTNGAGVQAFIVNTNATALGAATPNMSLGYTNSIYTASRATPTTLPIGKTAAANGLIIYSGTGAGKFGPMMPLQAGDAGITSIETIQNSVSYVSGEYSVVLCKPLVTIPLTTVGVAGERDLINQIPSLPRIYDGACLNWLAYNGAATPASSVFSGHLDLAWN